jgi:hypothetical protein
MRSRCGAAVLVVTAASGIPYWYWPHGADSSRTAGWPGRAAVPASLAAATRQDLPICATVSARCRILLPSGIHAQVESWA